MFSRTCFGPYFTSVVYASRTDTSSTPVQQRVLQLGVNDHVLIRNKPYEGFSWSISGVLTSLVVSVPLLMSMFVIVLLLACPFITLERYVTLSICSTCNVQMCSSVTFSITFYHRASLGYYANFNVCFLVNGLQQCYLQHYFCSSITCNITFLQNAK